MSLGQSTFFILGILSLIYCASFAVAWTVFGRECGRAMQFLFAFSLALLTTFGIAFSLVEPGGVDFILYGLGS